MPPFAPFFKAIIQRPRLTTGLVLLLVLLLATGLTKLQISNDFRVYLSEDNPHLKSFENFEANYVKSNTATLVVTARQGDVFTSEGLRLIEQLTDELWQVNYSYRVSSLTNYQHSRAIGDDIETNYLVEDAVTLNDIEIEQIKTIALNENRLTQSLITTDGKVSLIVANLNLPKDRPNASLEVTEAIEQIRDKYRQAYPQFTIQNGGSSGFNATLARAVAYDLSTLLPISYLVIFAGLLLFLRSLLATLAIFILISTCLIATFGFFGWVAPVLTPIAGFAPSILLSIMVADSVHILVVYLQQLEKGVDKDSAMLTSLDINFMPVLITSITTIIGFLSLNFSSSPPYQDLGNMVAFGVLVALLFSLVLLPALLKLLTIKSSAQQVTPRFLGQLAELIIRRPKSFFVMVSFITLSLITFIPNNRLSDNWAHYFDSSFELIQLVHKIDGYLTGINSLEYSLTVPEGDSIFSPAHLAQMDQFEQWFLTQDKVFSVKSLSQLMKELNQLMHSDDPQRYQIPASTELGAQYLLFYELGLPANLGLSNLVTIDKKASRFSVSVTDAGSDELLLLDQKAQAWLKANAPAIQTTQATGLGMVFAHIAQTNIESLLLGTFVALVGISLVLLLVLRSFKYGLISLVPNVIPALMAYGLWGMTFGYVDISLSIVACATLGIVVDDTVHFLHKYIRARRNGLDPADAIRETFHRVGLALLTTSVVLASGFIILAISHMNTSATIGILMSTTLIIALVVDFFLLPALLLLVDKPVAQQNLKQFVQTE